jgi:hypothetical protein
MALMRFDPFRELDRLTDQALANAHTARTLPMEALRREDQFIVALDVPQRGQRDFHSTSGLRPRSYDVVADVEVADRALQLLASGNRKE